MNSMWKTIGASFLPLILLCSSVEAGLMGSDFSFFSTPTAWDPGAGTARIGGHPSPGGATWSLMAAGIGADPLASDTTAHSGTTAAITALGVPTFALADYKTLINNAINVWAAVSGFTNLGEVADGGGLAGAAGSTGATGDIRVGAWELIAEPTLAHAFQPGDVGIFGANDGNLAGDVHIDIARTWVDDAADAAADPDFDLFTVVLHEIGHALGLGHSAVVGAVMEPSYAGGRRTLAADDIAGIQALYGPAASVPEPSSMALMVGLGAIGFVIRRRRRTQ